MKERLSSVLSGLKKRSFLCRILFVFILSVLTAANLFLVSVKNEKSEDSPVFEPVSEIPEEKTTEELQTEEEIRETTKEEFIPVGDIRIPHCGDINYSLSSKTSDFYFENPVTNACYLKVSITRLDTKENIFSSTLISPGKSISGIGLKLSRQSSYKAMIKVDAYALDRMVHLNSLSINTVIHAY